MDIRTDWKRTPLHNAAMEGRVDMMRWLLNNGADANVSECVSWTPLHLAARIGHLEVVRVPYEHNADIHARDGDGETPLHGTLCYIGFSETEMQVDVLRQLLEYGADSNVSDHNLSTPLHQASSRGWAKVAQLLLSYDARVDEEDEGGKNPIPTGLVKWTYRNREIVVRTWC